MYECSPKSLYVEMKSGKVNIDVDVVESAAASYSLCTTLRLIISRPATLGSVGALTVLLGPKQHLVNSSGFLINIKLSAHHHS